MRNNDSVRITKGLSFARQLGIGLLSVFFAWAALLFVPVDVQAQSRSLSYDSYQVDIKVNQDSTFTVRETQTVRLNGEYQGLVRGITLENPRIAQTCLNDGESRLCGGFEFMGLKGVYDESGSLVDESGYETEIEEYESTGARYFVVRRELWPGGKNLQNEVVTWAVEYKVYGGLGYNEDLAYLYWNAIPADLDGDIKEIEVNIQLPPGASTDLSELQIYPTSIDYDVRRNNQDFTITSNNYESGDALTVLYPISTTYVDKPARLNISQHFPLAPGAMVVDGTVVSLPSRNTQLKGLPTGSYQLEFTADGFQPVAKQVSLSSDEVITLNVSLTQPTVFTAILIGIIILLSAAGLVLIVLAPFLAYYYWSVNGQDKDLPETVIPLFSPPDQIRPYLAASLMEEKVHKKFFSATLIDLAYKGYIKITEIDKDNYKLERLNKDSNGADRSLNDFEKLLLEYLFDGEEKEVTTKDLKYSFYTKIELLKAEVRKELVAKGYFEQKPNDTRTKFFGIGTMLSFVGIFAMFMSIGPFLGLISLPGPVPIGLAGIVGGLSVLAIAPFMPAKTPKGSLVYNKLKGFKMYMHRAERYRLQGLDPNEFEKYLAFAIVFGIEKEWARKFADIYKGDPEWFDASNRISVMDAYLFTTFTDNFSRNLQSTAYAVPSSSSSSGGGFSGGSFGGGGFSGGGGGGGFSGGY